MVAAVCSRGMRKDERYTFTILNFEKPKSLFQNGMQPLVYSERRAAEPGGVGWARGGRDISYRPGRPRPRPKADETAADKTKTETETVDALEPKSNEPPAFDDGIGEEVAEVPAVTGRYRLLRKRLLRRGAALSTPKAGAASAGKVVDIIESQTLPPKPGETVTTTIMILEVVRSI